MISFDTVVSANGNGVNSLAFPALTTAETYEGLIAIFHFSNATQSGVTFSGGLSWSKLGTEITIPTAGGEVFLYYALASSIISSTAYTATFTGAFYPQVSQHLMAFKGVKKTGGFIGASNTGSTGSATSVSASVTTTANNSLVVGGVGQTANIAMSPGSGQNEAAETTSAGGFSRCQALYRNAVTGSSGTSVAISNTTGSNAAMGVWAVELLEEVAASIPSKILQMNQAVQRSSFY